MKPWQITIIGVLLFGVGALVVRKSKAPAGITGPTYPDSELGTVAAVPGLAAREQKEPGFVRAFLTIAKQTGADPDKLATIMSEESGFDPKALNPASGTVGFLQWMPAYIPNLIGTTASDLHGMTGIEQLEYVKRTVQKVPAYKTDPGLAGLGHGAGTPDGYVLATKDDPNTGAAYSQNKGYDREGKGHITSGDVRRAVYAPLAAAKGRIGPDGRIS